MIGRSLCALAIVLGGFPIGCSGSDQETGTPPFPPGSEGLAPIGELRLGQCAIFVDEAFFVESVRTLPCSEPHALEVAGAFALADEALPSNAELLRQSDQNCRTIFETYTGAAYWDSPYDVRAIVPSASSWARGDREVTCLVVATDGEPFTGPARAN